MIGWALTAVGTYLPLGKKIELSRLAVSLESTVKLERAGQPCATKMGVGGWVEGREENSAEGSGSFGLNNKILLKTSRVNWTLAH